MTAADAARLNRFHAEHVDTETIGDNPAWLEAVDADIRADVHHAIRAILIGAAVALILVGCIALFQSVILWRL